MMNPRSQWEILSQNIGEKLLRKDPQGLTPGFHTEVNTHSSVHIYACIHTYAYLHTYREGVHITDAVNNLATPRVSTGAGW